MGVITGFIDIFNQLKNGLFDLISVIWKLPDFLLKGLNLLPDDLVIPFSLIIGLIIILLIYRFIK